MEATKEPIVEQQSPPQTMPLGNQVPNSFEELNEMRQSQNLNPYPNTLNNPNKTYSNFASHGNSILQSTKSTNCKNCKKYKMDPLCLYANSMNLPKDVSIVRMPKSVDKKKYEIPPSEYIWDAPYLKKTQIFPSYVRKNFFIIIINYRL